MNLSGQKMDQCSGYPILKPVQDQSFCFSLAALIQMPKADTFKKIKRISRIPLFLIDPESLPRMNLPGALQE